MPTSLKKSSLHIRDVWDRNLVEEFRLTRDVVENFPYIAIDTEFPGVVLNAVGEFSNRYEFNYRNLKENVDILKLIQLGLTFSDEEGNLPKCGTDKYCIWQFNFREFNVNEDVFAQDSIELLRRSGIDFGRNKEEGVHVWRFGELVMSSGIVLNDNVQWVAFDGKYDFGYFLKLLTGKKLPDTPSGFFNLMNVFFPILYDIKYIIEFSNSLHGGLENVAQLLQVQRIGTSHQAGSDSLLTSCIFRKLKKTFLVRPLEKYAGALYGLSIDNGLNRH